MKILLLAVPYDSGNYRERLGLGPLTLISGIEDQLNLEGHSVRREEIFIDSSFLTEVTTSFEVSRQVSRFVREAKQEDEFPIILSGNCNTAAVGTLCGLNDDSGVMWFDCHGDFNTPETTEGGFLDGMALSIITGQCWSQITSSMRGFKPMDEHKIILIGAHDFDTLELDRLNASNITLITPQQLEGNENIVTEKTLPVQSLYLHIDLDVIDPSYAKVNNYAKPGGLTPEQLYQVVKSIKCNYTIAALAFTAYDPALDPELKIQDIVNRIVEIVV